MVLFIAHFLRRVHQQMHVALSAQVTWNFLGDKLPNGAGGAFDNAFAMLLGLSNLGGQLRWGYFMEGDSVETDLLADNVAGLLNESMRAPQRYSQHFVPEDRGSEGLFYWERWAA